MKIITADIISPFTGQTLAPSGSLATVRLLASLHQSDGIDSMELDGKHQQVIWATTDRDGEPRYATNNQ